MHQHAQRAVHQTQIVNALSGASYIQRLRSNEATFIVVTCPIRPCVAIFSIATGVAAILQDRRL